MMIIRGVQIAGGDHSVDIKIDDGRIAAIVPRATQSDPGIRRVLLPGLVDLHTHLREPGGERSETIETGTRAAAAGGFTDVFAMANLDPVTDTAVRVMDLRRRTRGAIVRVHPVGSATIGLFGEQLVDHAALAAEGVRLFSDDGKCLSRDEMVRKTLERMAELGTVFAQHAQHPQIVGDGVINARVARAAGAAGWPVSGEEAIVARDIALVEATGGRLHVCHVSTRGTVELVREAKMRGLPVSAEVTPHHLVLTDDDAVASGPALKVNPPLRSPEDVEALREALSDGTIDAVGTDHAPHPSEAKRMPWPDAAFGLTGLETALPIVSEVLTSGGRTDWDAVARVMSFTPAEIGGIADVAGRPIAVGEPATFCVVKPGDRWTVHAERTFSRSHNTPFEGRTLTASVLATVIEGRVVHGALR